MDKVMEQLNSGKRINSAADDAAGLSIVTRLKRDINNYNTGNQNVGVARSFLETADGAADQASGILSQMKDLATQADDATLSSTDAANLQTQFNDLRTAYTNLVGNTKFNGKNLLNDASTTYNVNTGFSSITLSGIDIALTGTGLGTALTTSDISTQAGAQSAITNLQTAIDTLSDRRGALGSKMNVLDIHEGINTEMAANTDTARGRIEDADMAKATSEMTRLQIVQQSNLQLLQQYDMFRSTILSLLQR